MPGIGGTVADLLNLMEVLDNELETGASEGDETVAILALTTAQHWFETVAAELPKVLQSTIDLTTTANTETSTFSTSLLRLDSVWLCDASGNRIRELDRIDDIGGNVPTLPFPLDLLVASVVGGSPYGYYADATKFYWLTQPDAAYTIRMFGFVEQVELAARADNFNYPKRCKMPFAQFATKMIQIGKNDDTTELDKLAGQLFRPLLRQLRKFDRSRPVSKKYSRYHTT